MKFKEENKLLKDLVLTLYAYIPHCCYNCAYYEKKQLMTIGAITTIEKPKELMGAVALNYRMAFI